MTDDQPDYNSYVGTWMSASEAVIKFSVTKGHFYVIACKWQWQSRIWNDGIKRYYIHDSFEGPRKPLTKEERKESVRSSSKKARTKRMSTEGGIEKWRIKEKAYNKKRRQQKLNFFVKRCVCCGETDERYLEIDHVHNDGYKETTKNGSRTSASLKQIKEDTSRFQILCSNCNRAKHQNDGELYIPEQGWVRRGTELGVQL